VAVVVTLTKGYDLEYMWRQAARAAQKDAAGYYISAAEGGGEPPGRWWGPGARALGFEPGQVVEREPYDLLFGERKAPDGTRLGRPPPAGRKAAELYARLLAAEPHATPERQRELRTEAAARAARQHAAEVYARLLAAEPHATAERQRELRIEAAGRARQSPLYFDLTISFSKSISLFHASLGENARLARQAGDQEGAAYWSGLVAEVDQMIWQGVDAGFEYFQREAGYTRTGSHASRVDGRETGQWQEAELAVAHWLQHTSRDGDMQLHIHSQIAHIARTVTDGKWRAPDSLGYNEHIGAVAAVVSQHVEEALTRRFGLEWVARDDGHGFEIKGISGEMMRLFSSRRESITADLRVRARKFEARYERAPSQRELAQLAQASNFATRARKGTHTLDGDTMHADWADRLARRAGVPLASVAPSVWGESHAGTQAGGPPGPGRGLSPVQAQRATQTALALAQQARSTFTRADLIRYLGRVLPRTGMNPDAAAGLLEDLADRGLAGEFEQVLCLEAPEPVPVPAALLRADGRSVYQRHGGIRYATRVQLSMEERMAAQARAQGAPTLDRGQAARALGATVTQLDAALTQGAQTTQTSGTQTGGTQTGVAHSGVAHSGVAHSGVAHSGVAHSGVTPSGCTRSGLRLDQAAAAFSVLTDGRRVSVIDAPAGSGKTWVLTAAGRAWASARMGRVIGITPSQSARNTLAAGVPVSYNTAQFLGHLPGERGVLGAVRLGPGDLVVMDEASMAGTPDLADVIGLVTSAGAKLILAGDTAQLQAVENGGGLSLLAATLGSVRLAEPVRFTVPWERAASLRLRAGDATVLAIYDEHGRITGGDPEEMLDAAARAYVALTLQRKDTLLMAADHARRRELSRRIRDDLIHLGLVKRGPSVPIADGARASTGHGQRSSGGGRGARPDAGERRPAADRGGHRERTGGPPGGGRGPGNGGAAVDGPVFPVRRL